METFLCLNSLTFYDVFKHRFSTVEFNQNYLINKVNFHGQIGTLLKTVRFRESAFKKIWKRFFVCILLHFSMFLSIGSAL